MPKKITYYVQRYRPSYEAISKEVALLAEHFSKSNTVMIQDLHLDGLFNFKWNEELKSYHFCYYPFLAFSTRLRSKKNDLNHIYTSLGDLPYLKVLNLEQTILTAAASCSLHKIKKRLKDIKKLRKVIVESEKQKQELLAFGLNPQKVEVIYPAVDLASFKCTPVMGHFSILNASCPTRTSDFAKRGIYLLMEAAEKLESIRFHLAWRGGAYTSMKDLMLRRPLSNMIVNNEIVANPNDLYSKTHATIIPYTQQDDFLKLMPNSAIESLAAGKPVLVSSKTEIAQIIEQEQCGVAFEPTTEGLLKAIAELKKDYGRFQKNCRRTAEKYFSKDIFIRKYELAYAEIP